MTREKNLGVETRDPVPLTVAGSDPTGGAGIELDLKVFAMHRMHGASIITCLTDQSTRGMKGFSVVEANRGMGRFHDLTSDLRIGGVKVGLLPPAWIGPLCEEPAFLEIPWRILDPVRGPSVGSQVHDSASFAQLTRRVSCFDLVTPNCPELAAMVGVSEKEVNEHPDQSMDRLRELGAKNVLLKGGHSPTAEEVVDRWRGEWGSGEVRSVRLRSGRFHGTGCALSASILVRLIRGDTPESALRGGLRYVQECIRESEQLGMGARHLGLVPAW